MLTIEIRAKPGKFQELYQTLQAIIPTIRKEGKCQDCRIYRDVEDGEVFFLSAAWKERKNMENYMRSNSGCALLGALDLLSEKVSVKIENHAPAGIEVLKRMRR